MKLTELINKGILVDVYKHENMAVKLFCPTYAKADVLYEALVHARVEETGLPVPQVLQVTKEDGQWIIMLEFVEGQNLQQAMLSDPSRTEEYLQIMLKLQLDIHDRRIPTLPKLKDQLSREIETSEIDSNRRYELLTRLEGMPKHIKLCHGNFAPSNVIQQPSGEYKVLDWIAAAQGNASADIAKTYLLLTLQSKSTAEQYLDMFCQATGTDKRYVQEWLPIVAAAHLQTCLPQERPLLLRWLDVVDYD